MADPSGASLSYPVTSDGYDVYGEIGSGAFATVYHGRVRATGEEVAIKVIDLDLFNTNWSIALPISHHTAHALVLHTADKRRPPPRALLCCALCAVCGVVACRDEIRREISTMSLLSHPNVVSIKCSFVDHQDLWIIMPLLQAGSCASIMKAIAQQGLKDEALLATILSSTLQGLQYLHKGQQRLQPMGDCSASSSSLPAHSCICPCVGLCV